jgi:predicted lipoprotein
MSDEHMPLAHPHDIGITYTVRELFEKIDMRLSNIDHKLDSKADRHEVDELADEVRKLTALRNKFAGASAVLGMVGGFLGALAVRALGG